MLTLGSVIGRNAGVAELVAQFSLEELSELIVGNYIKEGFEDIVFSSAMNVPGAAAETIDSLKCKRRSRLSLWLTALQD